MRRVELVDLLSIWVHFSRVNLQRDGVRKKCTGKSPSSVDTLGAREKKTCSKMRLGLEMEVKHSCILYVKGVEGGCGGLHMGKLLWKDSKQRKRKSKGCSGLLRRKELWHGRKRFLATWRWS